MALMIFLAKQNNSEIKSLKSSNIDLQKKLEQTEKELVLYKQENFNLGKVIEELTWQLKSKTTKYHEFIKNSQLFTKRTHKEIGLIDVDPLKFKSVWNLINTKIEILGERSDERAQDSLLGRDTRRIRETVRFFAS